MRRLAWTVRGLILRLALIGAGLWLVAAPHAAAHTVETTDGTVFEGKIVLEDDEKVVIETTFDGTRTVARADIKKINNRKPPLRDQLAYRTRTAPEDAKALWALYKWGKKQGFSDELKPLLERVIVVDPKHRKAREALGHIKVEGTWMTPEAKAKRVAEAHEAEMRAKGLVPFEGGWVTPEEKRAREEGLRKDGDDWVTEEEWHKRRGEQLVDGKWVQLGKAEGAAWTQVAKKGARLPLRYLWSAHYDVVHDVPPEMAKKIATAAEAAWALTRTTLRPEGQDLPDDDVPARLRLVLLNKLPAYVRFSTWFAKEVDADSLVKGWANAVKREHAWWWVQDINAVGCYQFPNTDKTFISNAIHQVAKALLTIYKRDYRFPKPWLREGFAYYVEMGVLGYSLTFSLGRGAGSQSTGDDTQKPVFADSAKWRSGLRKAVTEGSDPPLRRLARMGMGEFRYIELVKAWSVVEYLVTLDAVKFKAFVDATKDRDLKEAQALKATYACDYRELDRRWRAWVKAGFKHAR